MSERYTRLYKLPESLYSTGAPVLITAGALLKDNQTGKVLAQLKIQNISTNNIKAVTAKIVPFDTANRELDAIVNYQYLDLNIARDSYFGEQIPIEISDLATRSFSVAIVEVIFSDNSIWTGEQLAWKKQILPLQLHEKLKNPGLIKQYQINLEITKETKYQPLQEDDLWICTCGAINRQHEKICHSCGIELNKQLDILNLENLKHDRDIRLKEESAKAEEERLKAEKERLKMEEIEKKIAQEKAAKKATAIAKGKKVLKYIIILLIIVAIGFVASKFILNAIEKSNAYNEAVALLDAEEYDLAIESFKSLENYKDSEELEMESMYQKAEKEYTLKNYPEALSAYLGIPNYEEYKDCKSKIELLKNITNEEFLSLVNSNDVHRTEYLKKLEKRDDYEILEKYYAARKEEQKSILEAYKCYEKLPVDFLDISERMKMIEPYLDYFHDYSYASDKSLEPDYRFTYPVTIALKNNVFYGYFDSIRGQISVSNRDGYDYCWGYKSSNVTINVYISKDKVLKTYKGSHYKNGYEEEICIRQN